MVVGFGEWWWGLVNGGGGVVKGDGWCRKWFLRVIYNSTFQRDMFFLIKLQSRYCERRDVSKDGKIDGRMAV